MHIVQTLVTKYAYKYHYANVLFLLIYGGIGLLGCKMPLQTSGTAEYAERPEGVWEHYLYL